jgi:hypothetical protein
MRAGLLGVAALGWALMAGAAGASTEIPSGGLTFPEIETWLKGKGYAPETITDKEGKAHYRIMIDGLKYGIYVYDCKDGRCASLQFSVGWATKGKFDVSKMNDWNKGKRWCRGYYDTDNDPWVERDTDLSPGGTFELLDDELGIFRGCVERFVKLYNL